MRVRLKTGMGVAAALGLGLGLGPSAFAVEKKHDVLNELGSRGVAIAAADDWGWRKDLFGVPYFLIAPEKTDGGFRSNVSISYLGKTPAKKSIPSKFFEETEASYSIGRETFMREMDGVVLGFMKPSHQQRDERTRVHAFGYDYALSGANYHEQSHYVFCRSGDVWALKGLSTREPAAQKAVAGVLESFRCRK